MTTSQILFIISIVLFSLLSINSIIDIFLKRKYIKLIPEDNNFSNLRGVYTILSGYTDEELTDFGNYLLSDKRRNSILNNLNLSEEHKEESLKEVSHSDFENWKEK